MVTFFFFNKFSSNVCLGGFTGTEPSLSIAVLCSRFLQIVVLALTPPPDRAIPVLWQNFIRTFNVPGRLDTVPSAHSRSLAPERFLPQNTHATTRRGKVWPPAPGLEPGSHHRH